MNNNDERKIFFAMFGIIGDEVLGYCFTNVLEKAEELQAPPVPSNYLKLDTNYYKDVIKRLWRIYNRSSELQGGIKAICGVN